MDQSPRAGTVDWRRYLILTLIVVAVGLAVYYALPPAGTTPPAEEGTLGGTLVQVGEDAPDFSGEDLDGNPVTFTGSAEKPTWLVFNATWCANCRAEIPEIKDLAARSDVDVISVYLSEDASQVRSYADKLGLTYTQVPDPRGEICNAFGVAAVPAHVLVGKDGKVRMVSTGPVSAQQIDDALRP